MTTVTMPRGSILQIQGYDSSANGGDGSLKYNKVSEHNRSQFDIFVCCSPQTNGLDRLG